MSKELEALKRVKDFMSVNAKHWKQDVATIEKSLKALEIIKKKGLCWLAIHRTDEYIEYNNTIELRFIQKHMSNYFNYKKLTKEEYDLLKEELL